MIVLVVLLSLFGFSLSSNTLVVYHGMNGSSIMATYCPYNFGANPTYFRLLQPLPKLSWSTGPPS